MSWWSSFTSAVTDAANRVAGGATDAWSWSKNAGTTAALQIGDGGALFSKGWTDIFSGDFQQGAHEVGIGLAEMSGMPMSDQVAKRYEEAVGVASLWSAQQANTTNTQTCVSAYVERVRLNILSMGLTWTDAMAAKARNGVNVGQMTWINPDC
jgi:hypothetical protein